MRQDETLPAPFFETSKTAGHVGVSSRESDRLWYDRVASRGWLITGLKNRSPNDEKYQGTTRYSVGKWRCLPLGIGPASAGWRNDAP